MTHDEATKMIGHIEDQYAKEYPQRSKDALIKELVLIPVEAGRKACIDILANTPQFFPTPANLIKVAREWAAELREQEASRMRRENQKKESFLDKPTKEADEHAKRSCQLIRAALSGMINRSQLLEGMRHLSTTNPQAGWMTEVNHLEKFYKKRNLQF